MILRGLKMGLLLQLAVGPICLFIFRAASFQGFGAAFAGVAGVSLADGLYILAALRGVRILGAGRKPSGALYLIGAGTLLLFGLNMVAGMFNWSLLPSIPIAEGSGGDGLLVRAFLLTASNPLTLLFWTGIFSAKMIELRLGGGELLRFGTGCLLATVLFLTGVALLGHLAHAFVTPLAARWLNFMTGIVFLYYSFRLTMKWIVKPGEPTA